MNGRTMALAAIALIALFLASYAPLLSVGEQPSTHEIAPQAEGEIPNIDSAAPENYGYNIGPGFPAVILANSTEDVVLVLRVPEAENVSKVIISRVSLDSEGQLIYEKHEASFTRINSTALKILSPGASLEPGLYDIVLVTSDNRTLLVPRSLWVTTISTILDGFEFMHISDLHFGAGSPNITVGQNRRFTGYLLSQLLGVDAILNTGDEADTASSSQYRNSLAFRYMLAYTVPMFLNPGNHDYPNKNFITYYGDTVRYALIGDKILIISINTDGEVGHADNVNMTFLENVLSEYRNIPIKIIMMHHPIFYYQGKLYLTYNSSSPLLDDPNDNRDSALSFYWGADTNMTRWFLRLVEQYNVTMVLAGHIHRDQYVEYHSTWTGHTTYFQTTTTLAHGTGTYQGFQVTLLNITTGTPSYPYAPEWFIGYENHSRRDVYNSIPLTLPNNAGRWKSEFDHDYIYGEYHQGRTGIIVGLYNMLPYLSINKTVIISLPWPNGYEAHLKILNAENASVSIRSSLYVPELNRMFLALHFNMTPKSMLEFALYTLPDNEPPKINLKRTLPRNPGINKNVKVYITVEDDGWGVKNVKFNITVDRGNFTDTPKFYKVSDTLYVAQFKVSSNYEANVTLTVTATDYAGNTNTTDIIVHLAGPKPPANETTTTSPAGTSTTTVPPETTSQQETTTPGQTTSAATTQETATGTTGGESSTQPPGETATGTEQGGVAGKNLMLGIIAVIVIVVALILMKR